jgi:hypothetical protein
VCGKPVVSCPGCILPPVQRLVEKADVIRLCRINKSSRMAAVDSLREGALWGHILHIKLMNGPIAGDGQGEHRADHGRLNHRAEGLIAVDTGSLGEAVKDPTSLVPF